jgi:hypothetical protein
LTDCVITFERCELRYYVLVNMLKDYSMYMSMASHVPCKAMFLHSRLAGVKIIHSLSAEIRSCTPKIEQDIARPYTPPF